MDELIRAGGEMRKGLSSKVTVVSGNEHDPER